MANVFRFEDEEIDFSDVYYDLDEIFVKINERSKLKLITTLHPGPASLHQYDRLLRRQATFLVEARYENIGNDVLLLPSNVKIEFEVHAFGENDIPAQQRAQMNTALKGIFTLTSKVINTTLKRIIISFRATKSTRAITKGLPVVVVFKLTDDVNTVSCSSFPFHILADRVPDSIDDRKKMYDRGFKLVTKRKS
jgi:hypothetical protein